MIRIVATVRVKFDPGPKLEIAPLSSNNFVVPVSPYNRLRP